LIGQNSVSVLSSRPMLVLIGLGRHDPCSEG